MEDAEEQTAIFGALADPTRLKLLKLLCSQEEPDALCVNALTGLLGITQPAVSQHLKVLKDSGWISGIIESTATCYQLNEKNITWFRSVIGEIF